MNSYSKNSSGLFMNFAHASFVGGEVSSREDTLIHRPNAVKSILISCLLACSVSVHAQDQSVTQTADRVIDQSVSTIDELGYKIASPNESEFDNHSDSFVKNWRQAEIDYDDTVFGERMYNEASTPTKLEMLRLLSKDTPSAAVFMHAISMGLELDEVLQAAVKYDPSKGRELASSAVSLIPIMPESATYLYSSYELEDLDRDDETQPYSVAEVIDRFFKERRVLRPYPDWYDGQYHFLASAAELKALQMPNRDKDWYESSSSEDTSKRPVFVALYEGTGEVLIDSNDRIEKALKQDSNALLPVVFIFNRQNERSVDGLTYTDKDDKRDRDYPRTIRGVQQAYIDKNLMLTPTPEWQVGDYHLIASMDELVKVFDIPIEQDFEPEAWQSLLLEAKKYTVNNTAFLVSITGRGDSENNVSLLAPQSELYASWDNPRSEGRFKYVHPKYDADEQRSSENDNNTDEVSLSKLLANGMILNRPDLIAALKALGVGGVPVSFYYIDDARVAPYSKGPRALIQAAIGAGAPPGSFGNSGGFLPPPIETPPPASPPGIQ